MDLPFCVKLIVVFCSKILIFHPIFQDMVDCYQDRMCHCYISPFLSSVGTDPFELGMKIRTFMSYRCMRA